MQEHPSQTSESATEQRVLGIGEHVRKVIGSYDASMKTSEKWDDAEMQKRRDALMDKLRRHEPITVLDIYGIHADASRQEAARIIAQVDGHELSAQQKEAVRAQHLVLSELESLGKSLELYASLYEEYEQMKKAGIIDPGTEKDVVEHWNRTQKACVDRITSALLLSNAPPSQKETTSREALKQDYEILRMLVARDADVPGHNAEAILPVYQAILSGLRHEYQAMFRTMQEFSNASVQQSREFVDRATAQLTKAYPQKEPHQLTREEAEPVLNAMEPDGFEHYRFHLQNLRDTKNRLDDFKVRGKVNVENLARTSAKLGLYQIERAKLATIRHHFDQEYAPTDKPPTPGKTPAQMEQDAREFLNVQQEASIGSLETYAQRVEEGVLHIGLKEKAETLFNERGRPLVARFAKVIANFEASWLPRLPFDIPGAGDKDVLRTSIENYLLDSGQMYDALGWPRGKDGLPKFWTDLTREEQQAIREKQSSIEKSILKFRGLNPQTGDREGEDSFGNFRESLKAVRMIINLSRSGKYSGLTPESLTDIGTVDTSALSDEPIVEGNIENLLGNKEIDPRAVYKAAFEQLQGNFQRQSEKYEQLLKEFHETTGIHFDFSKYYMDFKRHQDDVAGWILKAGLLAGTGAGAMYVGMKVKKIVEKPLMKREIRNLQKTVGKQKEVIGRQRQEIERLTKPDRAPRGAPKTAGGTAKAGEASEAAAKGAEGVERAAPQVERAAERALTEAGQSRLQKVWGRAAKLGPSARKWLGRAVMVATGAEAGYEVYAGWTMEKLSKFESIVAALEFMETHPDIDRPKRGEASRYNREVTSLHRRMEILNNSSVLWRSLPDSLDPAERGSLEELRSVLRTRADELYDREANVFPIERIMGRSSIDQKYAPLSSWLPWNWGRPTKDIVRVNYDELAEARGMGTQFEREHAYDQDDLSALRIGVPAQVTNVPEAIEATKKGYDGFAMALEYYIQRYRSVQASGSEKK